MYADLLPVTRRLLAVKGCDVDVYTTFQHADRSALLCCCQQNDDDDNDDHDDGDGDRGVEQAKALLDAGASPNAKKAAEQICPLFAASCAGNVAMVKLLLERGAKAERTLPGGDSVLRSIVVAAEAGAAEEPVLIELLELLVGAGAPLAVPAMHAKFSLVAHLCLTKAHMPGLLRRWVELGVNIDHALICAAGSSNVDYIKLLLQLGADPNQMASNGFTPLCKAISPPKTADPVQFQQQLLAAMVLLQAGADPNAPPGSLDYDEEEVREEDSVPPLVFAIDDDCAEFVQLLLQAGATKRFDEYGNNAFDYAKEEGRRAVLPLLAVRDGQAPGVKMKPCGKFDERGGLKMAFEFCARCHTRHTGAKLQSCSACMMVAYCGVDCQRAHWPAHKTICKKKKEMEEKRKALAGAGAAAVAKPQGRKKKH